MEYPLHCILFVSILCASFSAAQQAPAPAPAPTPNILFNPTDLPSPSPGPSAPFSAPSSAPSPLKSASETPGEENGTPTPDADSTIVRWCAVRDELADCQHFLSLLTSENYTWACVQKQSAFECMQAIEDKEADLISLDAGLAYIAFTDYSMKAILAEEYCYHSKSYEAVAVVNKGLCDKNPKLSLGDFRGLKSCHPGLQTAAGWNYPVLFLATALTRQLRHAKLPASDGAVITDFFSEACAPSELEDEGICTSCGNNGSCTMDSIYAGYSGAFRCLMDGTGDIAFLKSDTAQRLSLDGSNKQDWSTKFVNEFMYLCPQGGCRPINDNFGNCTFGSVPANIIMTRNSQSNARRVTIVQTLLNANWTDALFSGKNWNDHVLSAGAQNLVEVKELTRQYLGDSAVVAQRVQSFHDNLKNSNITSPASNAGSCAAAFSCLLLLISLSMTLQKPW